MGDLKTREYVLTYVKPDSSCVIAQPKLLLAQDCSIYSVPRMIAFSLPD